MADTEEEEPFVSFIDQQTKEYLHSHKRTFCNQTGKLYEYHNSVLGQPPMNVVLPEGKSWFYENGAWVQKDKIVPRVRPEPILSKQERQWQRKIAFAQRRREFWQKLVKLAKKFWWVLGIILSIVGSIQLFLQIQKYFPEWIQKYFG